MVRVERKLNGMNWKKGMGIAVLALILGGCAGGPNERSTGERIDDTTVLAKVKTALVNDPVIAGMQLDVDVHKGVVILNGAVDSESVKKKAEDTARGVGGVKAVDNRLVIRK